MDHVLKTFHRNFEFFYFKIAFKKSSFSTNEAVNFVLAGDDSASDFDGSGSEVSNEEFTDDDDDLNVRNQPLPEVVQRESCRTRGTINNFRRPGIRTRGENNVRMGKIDNTKLIKKKKKKNSRFLVKNRYRT